MAETSTIEWTDATWNPITGCSMVSAGCTNCYAMGLAGARLAHHPSRAGLTRETGGRHVWTGEVRLNEQWLDQPLRWRRPRRIFVCAHGDLFHESVPDEWIDRVFAVMALAPHHTFQVLTKRPERMLEILKAVRRPGLPERVVKHINALAKNEAQAMAAICRPITQLPNVWLGTSVEDQATADARIPHLLAVPAAVRFLSMEPLLGPVDLGRWIGVHQHPDNSKDAETQAAITAVIKAARAKFRAESGSSGIDWAICGGESGPGARPMHPDWARSLRDQCQVAGVAFFFKQWGEWGPICAMGETDHLYHAAPADDLEASRRCRVASACMSSDGRLTLTGDANGFHTAPANAFSGPSPMTMFRVGKKAAGRELDGRTWDQMPEIANA